MLEGGVKPKRISSRSYLPSEEGRGEDSEAEQTPTSGLWRVYLRVRS